MTTGLSKKTYTLDKNKNIHRNIHKIYIIKKKNWRKI